MEQHGWEVAVETMKGYLEMAELALGADGRWGAGAGGVALAGALSEGTVDN